jgi:lipopolysaccharide export system protein LptC
MAADNRYTLLVTWLKIVLPLIALALLSSIFLISKRIDPGTTLPDAGSDLAERLREPRLTDPVFTGVAPDGAAVTVTADDMRPLPGSLTEGTARTLTVKVETTGGAILTLTAPHGKMDSEAQTLALSGGATVSTDDGYSLAAPEMTGSLPLSELTASGGVTGESPFGTIRSDRMLATRNPASPETHIVDFIGGVRLIYQAPE